MSLRSRLEGALRVLFGRPLPNPPVRMEHAHVGDNQLLRGRNVLVTGVGRNIGRSIALEMAQQGAAVYFTDRDAGVVADLHSDLAARGVDGRGFVSDAGKANDVATLCRQLDESGVLVDVLVNNVGIHGGTNGAMGILGLARSDLERVFATNVFGPLQLTQHVVRRLVDAGRPGTVLFITSVHAEVTSGNVAYGASKGAMAMVVRELAFQLAPHRIRVNGIAPGAVRSDANGDLPAFVGAPLHGSCIHPDYIGRTAVYLAADYFSEFTTGSIVTVDAGLVSRPPA